jgi:hypothetical protein
MPMCHVEVQTRHSVLYIPVVGSTIDPQDDIIGPKYSGVQFLWSRLIEPIPSTDNPGIEPIFRKYASGLVNRTHTKSESMPHLPSVVIRSMLHIQMSVSRKRDHSLLRLFATTTSLTTTKHLLDNGFRFPMHLLVLQLGGALGFRILQWFLGRISERRQLHLTIRVTPCEDVDVLRRLLYAVSTSGAYVCGYQAIHHSHNLPVVAMIMSVNWQPLASLGLQPARKLRYFASNIMTIVGISIILGFDFRASAPGILMSLLAALFAASAKRLKVDVTDSEATATPHPHTRWSSWLHRIDIDILGHLGSTILALFWCHFREQQYSHIQWRNPISSNAYALALSIASSTISLATGGLLFCTTPRRSAQDGRETAESHALRGLCESVTLVVMLTISNTWYSTIPPLISPWQWVGFGVGSLSCLPWSVWTTLWDGVCLTVRELFLGSYGGGARDRMLNSDDSSEKGRAWTNPATGFTWLGSSSPVLITAVLLFWALFYLHSSASGSAYSALQKAQLDNTYQSPRALDIVIAQYEESASEVARHVNELFTLPVIAHLSPDVIIYSKFETPSNTSAFLEELYGYLMTSSTPVVTMRTLPNVGRETDTYLEHITTQWDNLANHTLFMQAGVHYGPSAYVSRIRDYFVPSTGFLSLAPPGGFCSSCEDCHDRDWAEDPDLLRDLYGDFNGQTECANVVLTYRGQFLASAARLRGNSIEPYQRWLYELREPLSRVHTAPYTENAWSRKKDSLSAPRVGFTLERAWGIILQCSEKKIASRCPSLLSSSICPRPFCDEVRIDDCQCLDI